MRKALDIDINLAEAHTTMGWALLFDWDFAGAEQEFRKAIQLDPKYAVGHYLFAMLLRRVGRNEEALAEFNRALELEPFAIRMNTNKVGILISLRRYEEAIEHARRTKEMDPNFPFVRGAMANAYFWAGRYDEWVAEMQENMKSNEFSPEQIAAVGDAYKSDGVEGVLRVRLEQQLLRVEQGRARDFPNNTARRYAMLGEKEKALELLEKMYEEHDNLILYALSVGGPAFDSLRSEPRFQDLLRRMNFPE